MAKRARVTLLTATPKGGKMEDGVESVQMAPLVTTLSSLLPFIHAAIVCSIDAGQERHRAVTPLPSP